MPRTGYASSLLLVLISDLCILGSFLPCDLQENAGGNMSEAINKFPTVTFCDVNSMEFNAIGELHQLEYSWKLIDNNMHPLVQLTSLTNSSQKVHDLSLFETHKSHMIERHLVDGSIEVPLDNNPCFKLIIREKKDEESKNFAFGGSSFYATVENDESIRICSILNSYDGVYTIHCPRPRRNTCVYVNVILEWEQFQAFHNSEKGGGTINADSGATRQPYQIPLVSNRKYCEGNDAMHSQHHQGRWVKTKALKNKWETTLKEQEGASSITELSPTLTPKDSGQEFAPWQQEWVWEDQCGRLQQHSKKKTEYYRNQCFKGNDLMVEFLGGSHLNYLSTCFLDEILRFSCSNSKVCPDVGIHHNYISEDKTKNVLLYEGRDHFFEAKFVKDKILFHKLIKCGDRRQDCLSGVLKDNSDYYFGPATTSSVQVGGKKRRSKQPSVALRAVITKTTTLGSAVSMLHMIYLNIPPHITPDNPYSSNRVVVIMSGHWDAASQRDPRSYLQGELPELLEVVSMIRQDARTSQIRILFSTGPSQHVKSTGWRNNHALAAANAYIQREIHKRPDLRIELLEPSYMQVTLPRMKDTVDKLHFLLHGDPKEREKEGVVGFAGDLNYCPGSVGQSFSRMMLDQICSFYD